MKEVLGLSEELVPRIKEDKRDDQKKISFSQYSVYESCPYRWYLSYAKGIYPFSASINTVFGTAIHETLQTYLTILFNKSVKESEEFNMVEMFERVFREEYLKEVANNGGNHFSTKEEMAEFYEDGIDILYQFRKKRTDMVLR